MPRFSCSSTRASGNRSRTSSRLPSVEPWSTTIVSWPVTDSRHRSSQGSAFQATTTTETSSGIRDGDRSATEAFPDDHGEPRQGEHDRHHEEEEPGRECSVGADAELAEEVDEERLANG